MNTAYGTKPDTATLRWQRSVRAMVPAMALGVAVLVILPACGVQRGQESVGAYVDDATITAKIKARFVEDRQVDAAAISVETLKGMVKLSGFARNATERRVAESLARSVKGVVSVDNDIVVSP